MSLELVQVRQVSPLLRQSNDLRRNRSLQLNTQIDLCSQLKLAQLDRVAKKRLLNRVSKLR
mgnify:CR=1 FL=1